MATSEALAIERLARADIESGLRLSDAARWNQTADDWAFFIEHGEAFGIRATSDDGLVATAAALPYGGSVGWIAMVLVDAGHRHRGLATRLVGACVDALHGGGRVPVLDATPDGAAVYRRAGFVSGFAFERWQGEGAGAEHDGAELVAVADARQRDALLALDRSLWDLDRSALLRAFLARPATRAWLTADASGFAVLRAGRRAQQLGPVVAANEEAAIGLVQQALGAASGPVFIDVPVHWPALAAALPARGFVRQRPFVRMALGAAQTTTASGRAFAVAGPEFG